LIPRSVPPEWQYYLNPWWREEHEYVTRLDGSECRRRLEASTTRFLGRSVGRAWFSPVDFTLHRVTFYNNGFKPFAYLTFDESQPQQTTVRLTFSGAWSAQVFFGFWYAFMAIFAAVATWHWPHMHVCPETDRRLRSSPSSSSRLSRCARLGGRSHLVTATT
jgi:hypothetical protein